MVNNIHPLMTCGWRWHEGKAEVRRIEEKEDL